MPNKVEGSLPLATLQAFIEELHAVSAKPTLALIQTRARAYGLEISLMSAKSFRDKNFDAHLKQIANGREKAAQILAAVRDGGAHPLDAVEEAAACELLDLFTSGNGEADTAAVVKTVLNLRSSIAQRKDTERSDRDLDRRERETTAKLQLAEQQRLIAEERAKKLERERAQWEAAQKKVAAATEQLRNAKPADADATRARVVEMLDDVLGIKPKK